MKAFNLFILFLVSSLALLAFAFISPEIVKEDCWAYLTLICMLGTIGFAIISFIENLKSA